MLNETEAKAIAADLGLDVQEGATGDAKVRLGIWVGRDLLAFVLADNGARGDVVDVEGRDHRRLTPDRWIKILKAAREAVRLGHMTADTMERMGRIESQLRELVALGDLDGEAYFPGGKLPQ